jgi:hypothetical protein
MSESSELKIVGVGKEEILNQCKAEQAMALDYVKERREQFRSRLKLYNNQRKQRDKIGILTLYTIHSTLLAVYYTDEMQVEFSGREIADSRLAENINATAKFDHEEMGLDRVNYFVQWDRLFYGVGLRDMSTYDLKTNTPKPISVDPLAWLPDPRGGIEGFRFYGFEVDRNKLEMENAGNFFNLHALGTKQKNDEADLTQAAKDEAYGLNSQERVETTYANKDYAMIDWYTILKNEKGGTSKYLVTTNPECSEIFRIEKLKPVTEEEIADESKVPWPLTANYYSPQRDNPFGLSVGDLVEDKQRAKSILANLRIAKEKSDLYPMYLYNTQKIKNRRDLDFGFNKAIGVSLAKGDSMSDTVTVLQKDKNNPGTFNQEQSLDYEAQIATGADQTMSGVVSSERKTLGEIQQVSTNAQMRYLLGARVNAWGEKQMWKLWYRSYRQYFSTAQKKLIRIRGGFSTKFYTITRKDFITVQDPDITIVSKNELKQEKKEKALVFNQMAPILLANPARPEASRNFIERSMLRLNEIPQDWIDVMVPESPTEMECKLENELLSRNMTADIKIDEDHLSHMIIHGEAEDTPAKFAHIEAHRQAYVLSGQQMMDRMKQQAVGTQQETAATMSQAQIGADVSNLNRKSKPVTK